MLHSELRMGSSVLSLNRAPWLWSNNIYGLKIREGLSRGVLKNGSLLAPLRLQ